jgi:hypothetical protein
MQIDRPGPHVAPNPLVRQSEYNLSQQCFKYVHIECLERLIADKKATPTTPMRLSSRFEWPETATRLEMSDEQTPARTYAYTHRYREHG